MASPGESCFVSRRAEIPRRKRKRLQRELIQVVLPNIFDRGESGKIPFVPIIYKIAAKFEQISLKDMAGNPGNLSRCLKNCHKLFRYDAILTSFDETLEAEACGCTVEWEPGGPAVVKSSLAEDEAAMRFDPSGFQSRGRIPKVLEATRRLCIDVGPVAAIAGVINGPFLTASFLRGPKLLGDLKEGAKPGKRVVEYSIEVANTMVRLYCEAGVDMLVLREEIPSRDESPPFEPISEAAGTISNIANYYRVKTVLMARGVFSHSTIEKIFQLPLDAIYLSDKGSMKMVKAKAAETGKPYGVGFPSEVLLKGIEYVEDCVEKLIDGADDKLMFLTTEWEVPWEVEAESIHAITKRMG